MVFIGESGRVKIILNFNNSRFVGLGLITMVIKVKGLIYNNVQN